VSNANSLFVYTQLNLQCFRNVHLSSHIRHESSFESALSGLVTLTCDLLTSKWAHGSPVSSASCQFSALYDSVAHGSNYFPDPTHENIDRPDRLAYLQF